MANSRAGMYRLITFDADLNPTSSNYFYSEMSVLSVVSWMNGKGYKQICFVNEEGPDTSLYTYNNGILQKAENTVDPYLN